MSKSIFYISLLLGIWSIFLPDPKAQSNLMEVGKKYTMGKIYLKTNRIVKTGKIHLENDSTLTFTMPNAYQANTVSVSDVKFVKLKVGNNAIKYGAIGAGFMAGASLLALSNVAADPYTETKDNAGTIILGFIGGGAVVGALIGTASPKWKTFYIKSNPSGQSTTFILPSIDPYSKAFSLNLISSF